MACAWSGAAPTRRRTAASCCGPSATSSSWCRPSGRRRRTCAARDVLVASSPTLFAVVAAWVLSLRLRVPFVFEVRDLWPAIFADLGVIRSRAVIRALEILELFLYRRSGAVVTVTHAFARDIARRGIDPAKLHVVPNGVDLEAFRPGPPDDGLRRRLGVGDGLLVLYCGAHGISHALARILDVAERVRADPRFHFLFRRRGRGEGRAGGEGPLARPRERDVPGRRAPRGGAGAVLHGRRRPRPAARGAALPLLHPLEDVRDPRLRPADPGVARGRGGGDPGGLGRGPRGAARGRGRARGRARAAGRRARAASTDLASRDRAYVAAHFDRRALASRYVLVLEARVRATPARKL